jgi:hypothetical protein
MPPEAHIAWPLFRLAKCFICVLRFKTFVKSAIFTVHRQKTILPIQKSIRVVRFYGTIMYKTLAKGKEPLEARSF